MVTVKCCLLFTYWALSVFAPLLGSVCGLLSAPWCVVFLYDVSLYSNLSSRFLHPPVCAANEKVKDEETVMICVETKTDLKTAAQTQRPAHHLLSGHRYSSCPLRTKRPLPQRVYGMGHGMTASEQPSNGTMASHTHSVVTGEIICT